MEEVNPRGRSTNTVETRIIEPCARSLELPPLVRFGVFFLCLPGDRAALFLLCFAPLLLNWVILDYIAHGSIIRVSAVCQAHHKSYRNSVNSTNIALLSCKFP